MKDAWDGKVIASPTGSSPRWGGHVNSSFVNLLRAWNLRSLPPALHLFPLRLKIDPSFRNANLEQVIQKSPSLYRVNENCKKKLSNPFCFRI